MGALTRRATGGRVAFEAATTQHQQHLASLDLVRVGATLLVLFYHVHTITNPIAGRMPFGGFFQSGSSRGVDVFFVLSGCIVLWRHKKEVGQPKRWSYYMSQRLLRIYPPALIMTLLAAMMYAGGFGGAEKAAKLESQNLILSLFLMGERSSSVLNVAWTLKYVIFFYVLFGFAVIDRRLGVLAIAIWQLAILVHVYAGLGGGQWDAYFLQPMGLEFGMGAAAALLIACFPVGLALRKGTGLLVAGLITFLFFKLYESFVLHQDFSISIAVWLFGVSAASMIAGLALLDLRGHIRLPPIFRLLGAASFSVYLVNYSAIVMAVKAMQLAGIPIGNNLAALTLAGMAISCGLLFHFFVDQPLQRELRSTKALRLARA
jgi:exopolysaccharide production protein ExoZ